MKPILLMLLFSCFAAGNVFGQCLTPAQVDYLAPVVVGNTSYFFKYNEIDGNQLWKGDLNFENGVLVKNLGGDDIRGSNISDFVTINGTVFFSADGPDGIELWKSDGTATGTVQVKDIYTGVNSSNGKMGGQPRNLTNVNGILYFTAIDNTPYASNGLWKSDGTEAGTVKIKSGIYCDNLVSFNGKLYFGASDGVDRGLWMSNGTLNGTVIVKDLSNSGFTPSLNHLTVVDNRLYFSNVSQLWRSDGTGAGTIMIKQVSYSTPMLSFYNFNGTLFFIAYDDLYGTELWKSDGSASGTIIVKDIFVGLGSSSPLYLTEVNGLLYFWAKDSNYGTELWQSDGSEAGTQMVKEFYPGVTDYPEYPSELVECNGQLYFRANDGVNGSELWKSDGTDAGTFMLKDISISYGSISSIKNINGVLYFAADNYTQGAELWKSDGTEEGTTLVKNIYPGSYSSNPKNFTYTSNGIIFRANDGYHEDELWITNGASGGTGILKNIQVFFENDRYIETSVVNEQLIFVLKLNNSKFGLFKSDGTEGGTVLLNNTVNNFSYKQYQLTPVSNKLFFTADNGINGVELWKTDGTISGTVLVKDIYPASTSNNVLPWFRRPSNLINFNNTLFFSATDPNFGEIDQELWESDGTELGTVLVKDISPGAAYSGYGGYLFAGSSPKNFAIANNTLFFAAYTPESGIELWKSDGTAQGTLLVKDIAPGVVGWNFPRSSEPNYLTNANGTLFFNANDGTTNGQELWKSDGTEGGTTMVKNIATGTYESGNPRDLNVINNILYFVADDELHGAELWKSDGTEAGTNLLVDLYTGTVGSGPSDVYNFNGVLYFNARDNSNQLGVWSCNGTLSGTSKVNIPPYLINYYFKPKSFKNVNGTLFFSSDGVTNLNLLYKFSYQASIIVSANPSHDITPGTPVTLSVTNCLDVVSWDNGLGVGETKIVTPLSTTVYTATCSSDVCSVPITIFIIPCPTTLILSSTSSPTGDINVGTVIKKANSAAGGSITATNKITGSANVTYQARSITLSSSFKAESGTVFKAESGGCL